MRLGERRAVFRSVRPSEARDDGGSERRDLSLRLFQRLRRNHPGGASDGGRVRQVHAVQLVAGRVQMGFHAAKRQTQDLRDLLISFAARRPKVGGGVNENRQEFETLHVSRFVVLPFVLWQVPRRLRKGMERPFWPIL
jgi:hypothetical protein